MNVVIKYIALFMCAFAQMQSYGQLKLDDINLTRIRQPKIRQFIENQIKKGKHQFGEIHPSWNLGKALSAYRKKEMSFLLKGNLQEIWKGYITENPSNSWNGGRISFGLLLRKYPGGIFYNHDKIMGVDTGQVYFLNLKIMLGTYNIPVAFEIIRVDTNEKIIEFSYIEGNKSSGVQQLKFLDIGDNRTKIIHISFFKSKSDMRDKWIYPFFHKKLIQDFHQNMKRLLNRKKESNIQHL
jgi:hypothetical protein